MITGRPDPSKVVRRIYWTFAKKLRPFKPKFAKEGVKSAEEYLLSLLEKDFTPGGWYVGVWVRDSYFLGVYLRQQGRIEAALSLAEFLGSWQIRGNQRLLYGRGSPHTGFRLRVVKEDMLSEFRGGLPSGIFTGFAEIYGLYPDIDSTSLYVALVGVIVKSLGSRNIAQRFYEDVEEALAYVERRDMNGDGLPEQMENEDWADNLMRSGNVTYTEATYLLALRGGIAVAKAACKTRRASELRDRLEEVSKAVDRKFWMQDHYVEAVDSYGSYITSASQDTALLLLSGVDEEKADMHLDFLARETSTPRGLLNIYPPRKDCAPRRMKPHTYQNSTVWPWFTAIQAEALMRYKRRDEGIDLLNKVFPYTFYEWYNPLKPELSGAYPFKTSAAAVLTAVDRYFRDMNRDNHMHQQGDRLHP